RVALGQPNDVRAGRLGDRANAVVGRSGDVVGEGRADPVHRMPSGPQGCGDGVEGLVEQRVAGELERGPGELLVDGQGEVERVQYTPARHPQRQLRRGLDRVDHTQLVGQIE